MAPFHNQILQGASQTYADDSYQIENSVRFSVEDTAHLYRTTQQGNNKQFTISFWFKPGKQASRIYGNYVDGTNYFLVTHETSGAIAFQTLVGGVDQRQITSAVFRDHSSWYHIVVSVDTLRQSAGNTIKVWSNGKLQDVIQFGSTAEIANNQNIQATAGTQRIGSNAEWGGNYLDAYLAEFRYIDGVSCSAAAFGAFDDLGIWNPINPLNADGVLKLPKPNNGTTWSSNLTVESAHGSGSFGSHFLTDYPATRLFNGNLNQSHFAADHGRKSKFSPSGGISYTQSVRVYQYDSGGSDTHAGTFTLTDNDGTVRVTQVADSSGQWTTLHEGKGTFTEILFTPGGDDTYWGYWSAVEVDGVLLIDGNTDSGLRTSYNDGTTWSDTVTGSPVDATKAFDNSIASSDRLLPNASNNCTWKPATTITAQNQIRLYCQARAGTGGEFKVNNTSIKADIIAAQGDNTLGWYDIGTSIDSTHGIYLAKGSAASSNCAVLLIEVDDEILVDGFIDNSFHLEFKDKTSAGALGISTGGTDLGLDATKAVNANPILKTSTLGVPTSGVRADDDSADLILAVDFNANMNDKSNDINGSLTSYTATSGTASSLHTDGPFGYTGSRNFDGTAANTRVYYPVSGGLLDIGTGDFTMELWYKQGATADTNHYIFVCEDDGYTNQGLYVNTSGLQMYNSAGTSHANMMPAFTNNVWTHIAVVRKSGVIRAYKNGKQTFKATDTNDHGAGSGTGNDMDRILIGGNASAGTYNANGYIADARYYKKAKYDKSFQIPGMQTFTVSNITTDHGGRLVSDATGAKPIWTTNDSPNYGGSIPGSPTLATDPDADHLLSCLPLTSAGGQGYEDDESPSGRTVSTVSWSDAGTVTTDTDAALYGNCANLDGNFIYATDSDLTLGTDDFTIEFWVKHNGENIALLNTSTSTNGNVNNFHSRLFGASASGTLDVYGAATAEFLTVHMESHQLTAGVWGHIAFVKDGDTMRVYVNGKKVGENSYWTSTYFNHTGSTWYLNYGAAGISAYNDASYQDLRFYNIAKYSSDFVTPYQPKYYNVDTFADTPTTYGEESDPPVGGEVRGNYMTWNPLDKEGTVDLSQGNLDAKVAGGTTNAIYGTQAFSTGKWYCEVQLIYHVNNDDDAMIGVVDINCLDRRYTGAAVNVTWYHQAGTLYANSSTSSYGNSYTDNDIIGIAIDATNGAVYFAKNGVWQASGVPTSGSSKTNAALSWNPTDYNGRHMTVGVANLTGAGPVKYRLNTGQRAFEHTAPAGYQAMRTGGIADIFSGSDVNDPSKHFDVKTYTGNGGTLSVKGAKFQPELLWIKKRSATANHVLWDAIRGATKRIMPDETDAEATRAAGVTAFNSDGFTTGNDGTNNDDLATYVSYMWDAGTIDDDGNTLGTINVAANKQWVNTATNFSITEFENVASSQTVGHGLSVIPEFIITKNIDGALNWQIYHESLGASHKMYFTNADKVSSSMWGSGPSSTLFTYDDNDTGTVLAYCWASLPGFSHFGGYKGTGGNSSTVDKFIYTGFKPKFLLIKCTSAATTQWMMIDTVRDPDNPNKISSWSDDSAAEENHENNEVNIYSNGFELSSNTYQNYTNTNNEDFIYAAWAENPFKLSRAC